MQPSFSSMTSVLAAVCALASCQEGSVTAQRASQGASVAAAPRATSWSVLLPWGAGRGEVGLRETRADWPGDGVAAIAPAPGDAALLLDRINQRVVVATDQGAQSLTAVPADADDLAAGPGGAYLVFSSLRARAFVYDGKELIGELGVDRNLRELSGFSIASERRVFAHNAHQETLPLGSPAAPHTLAATLHQKKKGARVQESGAGVSVRLDAQSRPELLVFSNEGRARVTQRHLLPERVLAARLVGLAGNIACLRLESAGGLAPSSAGGTPGDRFVVLRSAVCHDVGSGERVLERALGAPGLYLPKRELAVGDAPARLLFIRPEEKGLRVRSWPLASPASPAEVAR